MSLTCVRSALIGASLISLATASHGSQTPSTETPPAQAPATKALPVTAPATETLPAAAGSTPASDAPVKPARSKFSQEIDLNFYYSPSSGLKHSGNKKGDTSIERYVFNYTAGYAVNEGLLLQGGIHASYMSLNSDSGVLLPSHVQAVGLLGSVTKDLSDVIDRGWGTTVILRPMLTSSSSNFSASGVVVQGAWAVSYRQSETLRWSGGVVFSTHTSGWGVLPLAGLQWNMSEDWLLSIGFPETHVSYKLTEDTTLKGLVGFMQGSYRVKNAPIPGGGDTYLDFREIRIGAGVTHQFTEYFGLEFDAGAVVDRKFDYYNRDYKLKGDVAAYLMLSLKFSF